MILDTLIFDEVGLCRYNGHLLIAPLAAAVQSSLKHVGGSSSDHRLLQLVAKTDNSSSRRLKNADRAAVRFLLTAIIY